MAFWWTWCFLTALAGICTLWLCGHSGDQTEYENSSSGVPFALRRTTVVTLTVLALFLAAYGASILIWEDFAWYDNSLFTVLTLRGHDIPFPIWPESGRFFPLGLQEFNLIRHFTNTVAGYHTLSILELLILAALLIVLDDYLSVAARAVLVGVALLTPSAVVSFAGLIYSERNLLLLIAFLALCIRRFKQTHSAPWAVGAVVAAQIMLYLKEPVFLFLPSFAAARIILRNWNCDDGRWSVNWLRNVENRLDLCLAVLSLTFLVYFVIAMFPYTSALYLVSNQVSPLEAVPFYVNVDVLAWVLAAVAVARFYLILRGRAETSFRCGGVNDSYPLSES